MGKVYIKLELANFSADKVSEKYRTEAAETMLAAARKALMGKCTVVLDPKPVPKSGLSLSGAVSNITVTPTGSQTKVKAEVSLQLAEWPSNSKLSKKGEAMFGFMTGSSAGIHGSSERYVRENTLMTISDAIYETIRNRIDAGIAAWQSRTGAKLDKCDEEQKDSKKKAAALSH
jgi:hypothetical protein